MSTLQDLSDYAQLVERLRVNPKVVVHDGDLMFAYNVRAVRVLGMWGRTLHARRNSHSYTCVVFGEQPVHKISNRKELLELVNSVRDCDSPSSLCRPPPVRAV